MAAPLVAMQAAEKVVQAVSNDIVVLEGKVYRTVKIGRKKVLEPVDVQLHVNPVGIGAGLLAGAVGLLAADIAWNGIHFAIPYGPEIDIFKGLKASPYWQHVVKKLTKPRIKPPPPPSLPPPPGQGGPGLEYGKNVCTDLHIDYNVEARSYPEQAAMIKAQAKALGCTWAQDRITGRR